MCVVSMVTNHYWDKYPLPMYWSWPVWDTYKDLKDLAIKYDKSTGQPDCGEKTELESKEQIVYNYLTLNFPKNTVVQLYADSSNSGAKTYS